ncbi:glycosyltransferase [Carnobacterium viridans]|uniref:Glycosyl transferase family 2 n=1 Tax=Carnobacterium viridans TaxID=174587 RepID=A0A1H1B219_9LACT|nr:glycosyltransferase family 2 protein [Carnobacterium viridans]UDE95965.1 glycosyltransferase [Carnobacterium viridans]SDQ46005.1 Glycosyl transferase family 2 [Carnobacterium viridans]
MLISVIMPVYNTSSTLGEAVKSVLQQRYPEFELILINDGSSDSSPEICDLLAKTDKRIKVVHQENKGLSAARNKGIEVASGEFIAFIDSDDRFDEEAFLNFYKASIQYKGMTLYIMNFDKVYGSISLPKKKSKKRIVVEPIELIELIFNSSGVAFYTWNKIYHHSLFQKVTFPEGKIFEDIVTTYQLAKNSSKTVITNEIGYHYVRSSNTIVSSSFSPEYYDILTKTEQLYALLKIDFPELKHLGLQKLMESMISVGYKLSQAPENNDTEVFKQRLQQDIGLYQEDITNDKKIPLYYKVGIKLLQGESSLYKENDKDSLKKRIIGDASETEDKSL